MLTGAVNVGISQVKYTSYEVGGSNKPLDCCISNASIFVNMFSSDKVDKCQGICLRFDEIEGYREFITLLKEDFMELEKEVKERGKRNANPKPSYMYPYSNIYFYKDGRMRYGDGDIHSLITLVDGDVSITVSSNNIISSKDKKMKFKGVFIVFRSERDFEQYLDILSKSVVDKGKELYKKNL